MPKIFSSSVLFASLGLSIMPLFQNCSGNISFDKGTDFALVNGQAELVDFYISPNSWENRPKVNITAIVDNSNSMEPLQEKMSEALGSAIDPLTDFSGEIKLFTTTLKANSDGSDKLSGISYFLNSLNQISATEPSNRPYKEEFSLSDSYTINQLSSYGPLSYQPNNFSETKNLFRQSVLKLGTEGSSNEEGLCALLKAGKLQAPTSQGSFNTFLIVTNENDYSDLANCIDNKEYVSAKVEVTKNNSCKTDSDISNYPDCMYENSAKIDQTSKLIRNIASYSYSENNYGVIESGGFKNIMAFKYKVYSAYYQYKDPLKQNNVSFSASIYNDGLPSSTQNFSTVIELGGGSCSTTTESSCDPSTLSKLNAMTWSISGKSAVVNSASCKMKCSNKSSGTKVSYLNNSSSTMGRCEDVTFDTANFCNGKNDCTAKCVQNNPKSGSINGAIGSTIGGENASCFPDPAISAENFNATLFSKIGLPSSYYDSSGDTLNQMISKNAFDSANVSCQLVNKYHLLTEKNDVLSLQSSDYVGSRPSFYPSNLTNISCSSSSFHKDNFRNAGLDLDTISLGACGAIESTKNASISENTSQKWSLDKEGTSCSLSTNLRGQIPNYVPTSNIQCVQTNYSKVESLSCSLGSNRTNLCNSGSVIGKVKESCSNIDDKIDLNSEYSLICNSKVVGNYQLSDEETQNQVKINKFIPDTSLSRIAEYLEQKFGGNYYLANFVTPDISDEEYQSCVAGNSAAFSYGDKYSQVSNSINMLAGEDKSSVDSICKSSYAPALENVVSKILSKVEFSYRLSLAPNESIFKVFLVNQAGEETFVGADQYSYSNGLVSFNNKELITEDISSIRVQIWRDLLAASL